MHPVSDGEAYPGYTEGQRHTGGLHFLCVVAQGRGGIAVTMVLPSLHSGGLSNGTDRSGYSLQEHSRFRVRVTGRFGAFLLELERGLPTGCAGRSETLPHWPPPGLHQASEEASRPSVT